MDKYNRFYNLPVSTSGSGSDLNLAEQPLDPSTGGLNRPSWNLHHTGPGSDSTPETQDRPRGSRQSSLPRSLLDSRGNSIFMSGPRREEERDEDEDRRQRPPLLSLTHPSQEDAISSSQPPLSTLTGSTLGRRPPEDEIRATVDRRRIPQVEKDVDDPTTPPTSSQNELNRRQSTTLTTLSRLFPVHAPLSPDVSRNSSYLTQPSRHPSDYKRNLQTTGVLALPEHLYTHGLLGGRHSDITVNAFGHQYKLHRIILDRAPFFTTALSAPWLEANAKEISVHPEDIDVSITQSSFELALKRLYGCSNLNEEDRDAVGLFATGCWLEMQDLIESSIESMLRQMAPETLSPLIRLVTSNYYGRAGDKILASAKSMLCRDGWRMPLKFWDGIPGDVVREIVGGDGFFIDGEWDRWVLAKRILDRRLKLRAIEAGLVEPHNRDKVRKAPDTANLMAVRFDGVYRRSSMAGRGVPDSLQPWVMLYTHPDVEPILVLLDEGIHYVHLGFEQLQFMRQAWDCLGLPVMPEKVISNALWQQMELRQKVMNAREVDMELNLSVKCTEDAIALGATRDTTMSITTPSEPPNSKGKDKAMEESLEDLDSGSWDGNGKPRKFYIPSSDCNIVMGGNADPVIATSNHATLQRHANRLSATIHPEDVQWAADFAAITSQPRAHGQPGDGSAPGSEASPNVRYTHFPPFRFSAEFPNPRLLKEKKRVYSRTVFYAGSLWNIYIQKVASTRSKQLGVYLHRAKERETEEVIAGTTGLAQGSVDERIGQLEREMILRSERRQRRQRRRAMMDSEGPEADGAESSGSTDGLETMLGLSGGQASSARASTMRNLLARGHSQKAGQTDIAGSSPPATTTTFPSSSTTNNALSPDSDSESDESEMERLAAASRAFHVPTLPPYVDARPTIRTYFKIYSPSRGGRMLSVYESAPDRFNFSQSWGWKSSTLMLDDWMLGDEGDELAASKPDDSPSEHVGADSRAGTGRAISGKGDGKLRFMVVIGNV